MKQNYSYPGWTKRIALSVAAFCVAATAAHAQTVTAYGTGFDGSDTTNGVATPTTYNSPNTPTDPLSGQNGWASNDGTVTQGTSGTSTQLVGKSDYVGTTGYFTSQTGVLGGYYRTTTPTAAAPDVVPSSNATGGIVSLFHAVTVGPNASSLGLNVNFAVTSPVNFAAKDTFGLSLQNAAGTPLITFNFSPATVNNVGANDDITVTIGGTTFNPGDQIVLNGTYHLALSINPTADSYMAQIVSTGGGTAGTFAGSLSGAAIAPKAVTDFVALWNLSNKTVTNGAYQGAGDNVLVFDDLSVTVPEPSPYAIVALGVVGLAGMLRLRRKQA